MKRKRGRNASKRRKTKEKEVEGEWREEEGNIFRASQQSNKLSDRMRLKKV